MTYMSIFNNIIFIINISREKIKNDIKSEDTIKEVI